MRRRWAIALAALVLAGCSAAPTHDPGSFGPARLPGAGGSATSSFSDIGAGGNYSFGGGRASWGHGFPSSGFRGTVGGSRGSFGLGASSGSFR